jgi:P4 family phage/plasmid primase-like protien
MEIQILGLRKWFNTKKQLWQVKEDFFHRHWRAPSVADILKNPTEYLKSVPIDERYNLYFTVAHCHEAEGRHLAEQWVIPFDIDGCPQDQAKEVLFRATQAIGLVPEEVGSIYSGHGVWIYIQLTKPITGVEYFDQVRNHYKAVCSKMQAALKAYNLPGTVDPTAWSHARLTRMPETINKKEGLEDVKAYVINSEMKPIEFDLAQKSGLPSVATNEQISPTFLAKYPEIDIEGVEKGCDFLKWCKNEPENVREYQWYGMLSIVGRFKDGKSYAHAYSKGHPKYNPHETDAKLEQALDASGPRTCKNVEAMWDGCKSCPNYTKVTSPILIKSPDFVKTETTGFRDIALDKNGNPRPGKPNIEDLRKFFNKKHHYITMRKSDEVYVFNGTHWAEMDDADIKQFAYLKIEPRAETRWCDEFLRLVKMFNLRDHTWFADSTFRKINFKNGVLDLGTMTLSAHSPEFGFRYILDYDYDVTAESPRFDKFMEEVTGSVKDYEQILLEFMGYSLSNDNCWAQKALFMTGTGSNGKSTLCELLRSMAAKGSYSSILSHNMEDPTYMLQFDGALFNISEETGSYSMRSAETFKNLVSGGELVVKKLYSQPYIIKNRAKLLFSCNDLPITKDFSHALFRRMIIIPFKQRFVIGENAQANILEIMKDERSGIFNRIMLAYGKAKAQNRFSETLTVTERVQSHQESIDTVRSWFNDHYEVIPIKIASEDQFTFKYDIMSAYVEYCKFASFEQPLNSVHFWRQVSHFLPDLEDRVAKRISADGKRVRAVIGVVKRVEKDEF